MQNQSQNLPNHEDIAADVHAALIEDIGPCDLTAALIPPKNKGYANILSREAMVVCGIPWVNAVFEAIDPEISIDWQVEEGDVLSAPKVLAFVQGKLSSILTAERTALNFLQTLSAVATKTQTWASCIADLPTQLLDTRKTLPKLRNAQKYAVRVGGGTNHRQGLFDAILIKENHIKACGGILNAVQAARAQSTFGQWIEVEVETLKEFKVALQAKPHRVMLDNFDLDMLQSAVQINQDKPLHDRVILEASGGVTLQSLRSIAMTGVDYISVGAITKSIEAIDLSLLVKETVDEVG